MLLVPEMYLFFGVIYVELYLRANRIIWQQCLGQEVACTLPNSAKAIGSSETELSEPFKVAPALQASKICWGFRAW